MLPVGLTAKAIKLCAAGLGAGVAPGPVFYAITIHAGAALNIHRALKKLSNIVAHAEVAECIALRRD